jgi:hypothetical protein
MTKFLSIQYMTKQRVYLQIREYQAGIKFLDLINDLTLKLSHS